MESKKFKIVVIGAIVTLLSCITLWSGKADGQERKYPNKPIEMIVNYPPGGPTDIPTRMVVNDLSKELGVPISVEYKPGAGGMIGASYVATSKPDGYILLSTSISSIISAPFLEKESAAYDPLKDFTPIASFVVIANVLATHGSSNLTSFDAVIKFAKENPEKLTCSTPGLGTTAHLVLEVFKMYGVNIIAVPAKGGGPAATNLLGKHVDLGVFLYSAAVPHLKSGGLRLLASTDKITQQQEVPTLKEKGFPGCEGLGSLMGLLAPPNLPKPIQDQIASATRKVVQTPSIKKALEDAGYTIEYLGPDQLTKKFDEDYKSIDKIAKAAGLGKYSKPR
jgi:tripartite-type tricarboxylate transporter receptor subunit TctC